MCLIVLAWRVHADFPLIVAANRDEFYERPSLPAHFWQDRPAILAGRDLRAGGTWLGVNRRGDIAAVTNVRDPADPGDRPASRGELPLQFLCDTPDLHNPVQRIAEQADRYNGFNLLCGNTRQLTYLSNRSQPGLAEIDAGVHGLSNAGLNTPWPKVAEARKEMADILRHDWRAWQGRREELFDMLRDARVPPDTELPDTGVGLEMERLLGPRFIQSEHYGTRASTVVLFHRSGAIHLYERQFRRGRFTGEQYHQLRGDSCAKPHCG